MPARRKPTPPPPYLPIETMAAMLAMSGVDLACDRNCCMVLITAAFEARHVEAGLNTAQDRARELRAAAAAELLEVA